MQLRQRDLRRNDACRLHRYGGGLRRGFGRGKISRYQVQGCGYSAGLRSGRCNRQGIEASRRRRQSAAFSGKYVRFARRASQSFKACGKYKESFQQTRSRSYEQVCNRHKSRNGRGFDSLQKVGREGCVYGRVFKGRRGRQRACRSGHNGVREKEQTSFCV